MFQEAEGYANIVALAHACWYGNCFGDQKPRQLPFASYFARSESSFLFNHARADREARSHDHSRKPRHHTKDINSSRSSRFRSLQTSVLTFFLQQAGKGTAQRSLSMPKTVLCVSMCRTILLCLEGWHNAWRGNDGTFRKSQIIKRIISGEIEISPKGSSPRYIITLALVQATR